MPVKSFVLGDYSVNSYVVYDEKNLNCLIIDPGGKPGEIIEFIVSNNLKPKLIVNTHGHLDHIEGNAELSERFSLGIGIGAGDEKMLTDPVLNLSRFSGRDVLSPPASKIFKDGDTIEAGDLTFKVLHTPGHSPGSVTLATEKMIFCGDVLFQGSIGRTDFPGGSYETLIETIQKKLMVLPPETVVFSGHGPETTIDMERMTNPFLQDG